MLGGQTPPGANDVVADDAAAQRNPRENGGCDLEQGPRPSELGSVAPQLGIDRGRPRCVRRASTGAKASIARVTRRLIRSELTPSPAAASSIVTAIQPGRRRRAIPKETRARIVVGKAGWVCEKDMGGGESASPNPFTTASAIAHSQLML